MMGQLALHARHHQIFIKDPPLQSHAAKILLYRQLFNTQLRHYQKKKARFLKSHETLKCHYCGIPLVKEGEKRARPTIDHVIPIHRHYDPLDTSNWVLACPPCNGARSTFSQVPKDRHPEVFAKYIRKAKFRNVTKEFLDELYLKLTQ